MGKTFCNTFLKTLLSISFSREHAVSFYTLNCEEQVSSLYVQALCIEAELNCLLCQQLKGPCVLPCICVTCFLPALELVSGEDVYNYDHFVFHVFCSFLSIIIFNLPTSLCLRTRKLNVNFIFTTLKYNVFRVISDHQLLLFPVSAPSLSFLLLVSISINLHATNSLVKCKLFFSFPGLP